jgi:hypothetical protein
MARIPGYEHPILDRRKILDYCLSPTHPRGRHKARVFRNALGIDGSHCEWLCDVLRRALGEQDAEVVASDRYGVRWRIDAPVTRADKNVIVRMIWITRTGETSPRFVTCWVL